MSAKGADVLLELGAREAFVGDHDLAVAQEAFEQLGGDGSLGCVCRCEFEADRKPVG